MPSKKKPSKKKPAKKKPAKKAPPKKKPSKKKPAKKAPPKKKKKSAAQSKAKARPRAKASVTVAAAIVVQNASPPPAWSDAVKAHVASAASSLAGAARKLAAGSAWSFSEGPELNGLEKWGKALAVLDRRAGIQALVAAAQHGLPLVVAVGGDALVDVGFTGKDSDPIADGASVEVQLLRAARWLRDPSDANRSALDKAYDRTRQLNVWDKDLLPSAGEQFYWYMEVGQCTCAAILNDEKPGTEDSYYGWSPSTCIARGLVVAARGLRTPGADFDTALDDMGRAIASAFGVGGA